MIKYVLILFMNNGGNGAAIDHIVFPGRDLCVQAALMLEQKSWPEIIAKCVPIEAAE